MLVDHHCHLDFPDLAADLDGVVNRARAAGVGLMVSISMHMRRLGASLAIAEAHPNIFSSGRPPRRRGSDSARRRASRPSRLWVARVSQSEKKQ
jgi:Tat protein secretion system quality control protein TatD with DNase activity